MISYLQGKIIANDGVSLTILTNGGVGYKVTVKPTSLGNFTIGDQTEIITHLTVREDALDLYGFETQEEKSLFLNFAGVSGIGPKSALHLLSLGSVEEIRAAIARGDVEYLTKVSGVGKKTAERIVLELKGKVENLLGEEKVHGELGDVVEALVAMGYSFPQAREAVKGLEIKNKNSEELIREALRRVK